MPIYITNSIFQQLDLSLLRHFYAVASFGGFSRASRATGVSQPALSLGLKRLEKALDVILIRRVDQKFALTNEGLALFALCQRFETHLDSTLNSFRSRGTHTGRRLRIGTALSIGFDPLVSLCLQNSKNKGFTEIEMVTQNSFQLVDDLSEGRLDAALVPDDVYDNRLAFKKLWSDRVIFVVSKGSRGDFKSKSWKQNLTLLPLITHPRETPMRALVDKICSEHDLQFKMVYSTNSVDALKTFVARKAGGAFVLRSLVGDELKAQRLVEAGLPFELPKSGVSLATRSDEQGKAVSKWIGDALRS
jgi:DNA-binding transcriptional LysR family regulator